MSAQEAVAQLIEDFKFPIGKFAYAGPLSEADRKQSIADIAATAPNLRAAVQGLSDQQLDTPYRPGGWTVRQVVHHVPDSHMNSYIRFRLALTEDEPTIKPYEEGKWAELADAKFAPVDVSLTMLEAIHNRWVRLLQSLTHDDWKRTFRHPALGVMTLDKNVALYAWHGRHHVAHITKLRQRMNW